MSPIDPLVAVLAGIVQGIVEWLPVSSQGNLAAVLTAVGTSPDVALQLALFLQVGTTLSAAVYYREDVALAARSVSGWRPSAAFSERNAVVTYLVLASLLTGLVGVPLYLFAVEAVADLAAGVFVAAIGCLLVLTGVVQLAAGTVEGPTRSLPTLVDTCLVGAVQGLAVLPGVSRSGLTTSALLLRRYDPPEAFSLSFLLSIPAGLGAVALTVLGAGGLPGIGADVAAVAIATSTLVGYATIGLLLRVVDRVPFWVVCFGIGGLAIGAGVAVTVLS